MSILRPWGVVWNESIPYAKNWRCQFCAWECVLGKTDWYKYVVGFEFDQNNRERIILECPQCFEKFWFHCDAEGFGLTEICQNWPQK
jgi:hypothetical protein